jgi:16S rRNA (uracil1498-N3)-methyltransferase
VAAVQPDRVIVEIGGPVDAAPEWGVRITLAQAVLKGDKIDEVIRDAVMLGVFAVQLLVTARTETPALASSRGRRLERWQRIAVSSAKQCGRAVVPAVLAPATLGDVLTTAKPGSARLMLVEPSAARAGAGTALPSEAPDSALVLVGPEGGWSADEIALAMASGCLPLSLGPRTLRADAAAVVALSVMQYVWR